MQINRPQPDGGDPAETTTDLDNQLDDVYQHPQRFEKRCAAGEDDRLKWVEALRAEMATHTRAGWQLIAAGLAFSFTGTLLGFWA